MFTITVPKYIEQSAWRVRRIDYIKIMRDLREDADKTQQQVADYLGTSQTMYARYERDADEMCQSLRERFGWAKT